jgi:hypothetical protein
LGLIRALSAPQEPAQHRAQSYELGALRYKPQPADRDLQPWPQLEVGAAFTVALEAVLAGEVADPPPAARERGKHRVLPGQ